jgi:para-nitrobenzyl esterase
MQNKSVIIAISALLLAISSPSVAQNTPVLTVEGGQLEGVVETEGVSLYKGIPYAAPPVGELRWKQPQPVKPWQGVRRCDKFGAASLQGGQAEGSFYWKEFYQDGDPEMSEDCLYLNVWTPVAGTDAKLPVMFWIHGGAFQNGFGHEIEFSGDAYAKRGVVLVTINYRLGMCGFLAHPLLTAENGGKGSGNYGLFDQLAALKWVKKNIAAFGGDPDNVTVFGQSAGAGSVQSLISSPLSKGYINRAIIQSGGGLNGIIRTKTLKEAEEWGKTVWEASGIKTLTEMRAYPAEKFQDVVTSYMKKSKAFMGMPYSPCIDKQLLTASLYDVAMAGNALDIPYMIGYVSDDIAPEVMEKAAVDWSLLLEEQGRKSAYVYRFSRDLPGEDMPAGMKGAFHSAELWYVFGTLGKCWRPMEKADFELSERMVGYWTNFAKYGNPNGDGLPEWKPCTKADTYIQTLDISK